MDDGVNEINISKTQTQSEIKKLFGERYGLNFKYLC